MMKRAAVQEGRDQARRGEFVSDEEMAEFFKRHGVQCDALTPRGSA
jgi:predicted transcriptional regulator